MINIRCSQRCLLLTCWLLFCWLPTTSLAQGGSDSEIMQRLQRLEERQAEYEKALDAKDVRIRELEAKLAEDSKGTPKKHALSESPTSGPAEAEESVLVVEEKDVKSSFGSYTPGRGFTVARTEWGEVQLSLYSYMRYLNQEGLDDTYVDHFGKTEELDKRNDFHVNKVMLYTNGWFLDPKLFYSFYLWAAPSALGTNTSVLGAGKIGYTFNDAFKLSAGVVSLPTTRSTTGNWPLWHRVDNRMMADEFMRGSYTQGLAASGSITDTLSYNAAFGNNLSSFGVSAVKLDDVMNTISGALYWMPTTGEFGPRASIGDFENHTDLATLFGIHYTFSTEDKQSQPHQNDPENSQIRLSDGVTVFTPDALASGVTVDKLDYQMMSLDAGMKYRGFALEGGFFYRYLNNFRTNLPLHISDLTAQGLQIKASAMVMPEYLQLYANGSQVYGDYGDPWDAGIGLNWWPLKKHGFRINGEAIYMEDSPVGSSTLPYSIGGNGWTFVTNFEIAF